MYTRLRSTWSRRPRRTDPVLLALAAGVVILYTLAVVDPHQPGWWGSVLAGVVVAFTMFAAALRWEWVLALPDTSSLPSEEALSSEVAHGLEQLEEHLRRSA